MNVEEIRAFCMAKTGTTESFPFDNETLVFKVGNKIYALVSLEKLSINLKCDPERAIDLREKHDGISPGYHMNKQHWNTIVPELIPQTLLIDLINHSYELIFDSLPKKIKVEIAESH